MGLDVLAGVSLPITVKNTFIDIGLPTPTAQRRSSSAPPAELASSGAASEDEDFIFTPVDAAVQASRVTSTAASTAASSTASSSPMSTPLAMLRLSSRARPFQPWPARAAAAAAAAAAATVAPPPMPGPAAAPQQLLPWQPGYISSLPLPEIIGQAVIALAAALPSSGEVQVAARAVDSQHGWLVDVEVAPFDCMAQVLEHAKATLLSIAEQSSSVYVMGYRSKPFQEKHNAFQATLGVMEDANLACWDAYSEGVCYRGHCCRWQHPSCVKCLLVAVRPLLGAEAAPPVQPFLGEDCSYAGQGYY